MAGGDIAKALAGGAAPYLAEEIHKRTTTGDQVNIPANLMAHAVVNAALSLAKGENALAGASSAVTAEAVGLISEAYYDKKPTELKEDEKQTISALASLAAGLAGGLVGGDTASVVSGMQTGKVTVENNALSDNKPGHDDDELKREHGDRELKVISVKPWTGSLLDENGNPIPGAYKAGSVMPVTGKGASGVSNAEQAIKNADPKNLISRQNSNEMSGSDIKRLVKDMKANGFDATQPIDVAIVNGKMIIIDGHHRAAAAAKAGIKDIPIRINKVTEAQGNQLLLEAAEARSRY